LNKKTRKQYLNHKDLFGNIIKFDLII